MAFSSPSIRFVSNRFLELQQGIPPSALYHYTDQSGLLGILQSGTLWATKVQYMNDATEFDISVTLETLLTPRLEHLQNSGEREALKAVISQLDAILYVNICAFSFCRDRDLLSQWRGYSASGAGYAIGFSSPALLAVSGCRLGPCIYEPGDQKQIINELIDDMFRQKTSNKEITILELGAAFERALISCGAFFKDLSFKDEDEWRLVTEVKDYRDGNFRFRVGKSMLVPYYVLDFAGNSSSNKISDITVGPCPHPENAKAAVDGLLISCAIRLDDEPYLTGWGQLRPPVSLSTIPYRSW